MICKKCGAEIQDKEVSCSFCGYTIYERAEKEYFQELENIEEDVMDLALIPQDATGNSLKKMIRSIALIVLCLFLILAGYYIYQGGFSL